MITADGQTVCSVGSNEDLLEARLVGYAYDLDQKKDDHAKTLQQNENYVIQQVRDRFAGMEYVESWGELKNGCYFLIRTPLESIRESVSISNKFYFYVGIMIIVVSGFVIWFVTASALNVRTGAGMEYPNLREYPLLKRDNLIDVCDTREAIDGTKWYYVRIAGKYFGFVAARYIERQ